MPIHIKGSGGVQEKPVISVNANGNITATAGDESVSHKLSSSDDSDFIAKNIKSGKTIFGVTGSCEPITQTIKTTVETSGEITLYLTHNIKTIAGYWVAVKSSPEEETRFMYLFVPSANGILRFSTNDSSYMSSGLATGRSISVSGNKVTLLIKEQISHISVGDAVKAEITYIPD